MEYFRVPIPFSLRSIKREFEKLCPGFPSIVITQIFFDQFSIYSHIYLDSDLNNDSTMDELAESILMSEYLFEEESELVFESFAQYFCESFDKVDFSQLNTDEANIVLSSLYELQRLIVKYGLRDIVRGVKVWSPYKHRQMIQEIKVVVDNEMQGWVELEVVYGY